jgi:outer membrane receptor protein involved in Fe transport
MPTKGIGFVALLSVFASTVAGAASPTAVEEETVELERVEVTARLRKESALAVPISVSVLDGEALRRSGVEGFHDFASAFPGLTFNEAFGVGGSKHTIRGISTGLGYEINPLTAYYIGDSPIAGFQGESGTTGYFPNPALIDIDRIEVMRGPQGTLFGASAMGGAIRVIPALPDLYSDEGWVGASASSLSHGGVGGRMSGMANSPFDDGASAVRVAAFVSAVPGWIDNTDPSTVGATTGTNVNGGSSRGGRASYRLVSMTSELLLSVQAQSDRRDGHQIDEVDDPRYEQSRSVPEGLADDWVLANATLTLGSDAWRFVSITSYFNRTVDTRVDVTDFFNFLPFEQLVTARNADDNKEFTQEFRWQTVARDSWDATIGLFFQNREYAWGQNFPAPNFDSRNDPTVPPFWSDGADYGMPDDLYQQAYEYEQLQVALYADVTWRVRDEFEFGFGSRWFRLEQRDSRESSGPINANEFGSVVSGTDFGATPRVSLAWLPDPGSMYYATVSTGFRQGGTNDTSIWDTQICTADVAQLQVQGYDGIPSTYRPDTTVNYELGLKSSSSGHRVIASAAVYKIRWEDIQTPHYLDCSYVFIENAGRATSEGVEFELRASVTDEVDMTVMATLAEARFDEASPNLGVREGQQIAGVPSYGLTATATWYPVASTHLHLSQRFVGGWHNGYDRLGAVSVPEYTQTDLMLGRRVGGWELWFKVTNLFDEYSVTGRHTFLGQWDVTLPPREVSLGFLRRF